ncbi:HK97 gp10 family phage protein [Tissierella praeacuta]|uniref:HK97 gp10 family phage protein n=1 Tax=Tissierella praeacuta TaxID=43131 RepID=UPI001C0F44B4|nr:HK97 gp10 family phage protein [Tissierella praeacuta]MBU5256848.1 HK97 gp10 family phage protein [Tissierella praeacuta]
MSSGIFGLEEVLRDLDMISEDIDEAMDEIAKEVATEIQQKAIDNVNGPKIGSSKGKIYKKYKAVVKQGYHPYPVAVRTGSLKRSLKIKKMGKGRRKVFADMNIANYACHVHDGTSRMKSRPFLDDAVDYVMDSGKYLDIAGKIIDDILNK